MSNETSGSEPTYSSMVEGRLPENSGGKLVGTAGNFSVTSAVVIVTIATLNSALVYPESVNALTYTCSFLSSSSVLIYRELSKIEKTEPLSSNTFPLL